MSATRRFQVWHHLNPGLKTQCVYFVWKYFFLCYIYYYIVLSNILMCISICSQLSFTEFNIQSNPPHVSLESRGWRAGQSPTPLEERCWKWGFSSIGQWTLKADRYISSSDSLSWGCGQAWDRGPPLHAGLPESRPKHGQLKWSPVPLCSLCAWWAALWGTGGLQELTGMAWLAGPEA